METLYINGNVHTMEKSLPIATAFIVKDHKFSFVGTEEEAKRYLDGKGTFRGGADKVVDLEGRMVLPGFNDSHMHFIHYAKSLRSVNLVGTRSIAELKERMKAGLKTRKPEDFSWFEGEGWNHDYFQDEKRFPNKFDLDEVTGNIPTMIMRTCFHIGVLNTAAMEVIGLNRETAKKYGSLVGLLPNGEPDGVIKEGLLNEMKVRTSSLNRSLLKEIIITAQEKALAQGITSIQSDDIGYLTKSDYDLLFQALRELEAAGELRIRLGEQCLLEKPSGIKAFFEKGYGFGWGSEKARVTSIKVLSDGSLGARTAALRTPYADDINTKGLALLTQEELDELVLVAHKNNCPTAIHGIGDRAIEMSLNAIERAKREYPDCHCRHGIVHCQITDEALLNRFKTLDVLAFIQPIFIDYDMNIVEDRVGLELAKTSYAWKTMIQKGIHVSIGTDCPVEAFDTMPNIYAAVARKKITGDKTKTYLPEERLSMEEVLYAYTMEGAYASGEEHIKGGIAKGKLADFIVLDRDLFKLSRDEEILDAQVVSTYLDGKLVYQL